MPSFLLKELYMRIDKYISGCGYASRKDVKKLIKQGLVGEFDGIDVAIANKIAENVGKELQI